MNKFVALLVGVAAAGVGIAAATYSLQKKGVVNVEVTFEDENGEETTKGFDEIVDDAVSVCTEKARAFASDTASKSYINLSDVKDFDGETISEEKLAAIDKVADKD